MAKEKSRRPQNILGINAVFHESAAALIVDGKLVAACEEERFNRIKQGKRKRLGDADGLPEQYKLPEPRELPEASIAFCLEQAGLRASDIDRVAYSFDVGIRRAEFHAEGWTDSQLEGEFLRRLDGVGGAIDTLLGRKLGPKLELVSHHLAHAASAFYPSGFDKAAILIIDGIGEAACTTLAWGEGNDIKTLETFPYPNSLGFLWERASIYLGFSQYDASKVMGLAAYGDPEIFKHQFASILEVGDDGYNVMLDSLGTASFDGEGFVELFGPMREDGEEFLPHHMHVAAALQAATDAAVVALLRRLQNSVGLVPLCIAGGVALNCATNAAIRQQTAFQQIYIPSAPHDAGTAIGAALASHHAQPQARPVKGAASPYLGPGFGEREIVAAIKAAGLTVRKSPDAAREAADMIADGNIVGWFQGRMEFGPRALGNRSLLADPRRPDTRAILNRRVKHREDFRPFAPSVLAEHADDWFEVGPHLMSHEYMLFVAPAKPECRDRIPGVLHLDGTARLQLVRRAANPVYHNLISRFHERTGVPLVLNTSFNDSEPIVCTPTHAIATFRGTGIDALVMGDYVLTSEN